jgi:glycosyl transferase family 25
MGYCSTMLSPAQNQIPVLIINLARASERRRKMETSLGELGVRFSFFPAVDGSQLDPEVSAKLQVGPCLRDYGRALTPNEIGCVASYHTVLKSIADGDDPYVCVLEDDALPTPILPFALSWQWLDTLPRFDILRLVSQPDRLRKSPYVSVTSLEHHAIVAPVHRGFLATGQIITRECAKRLLARLVPVTGPIDNMLYRDPVIPLRVLETRPGVVMIDASHESQMDGRFEALERARRNRRPRDLVRRIASKEMTRLRDWRTFIGVWGFKSVFAMRWPFFVHSKLS